VKQIKSYEKLLPKLFGAAAGKMGEADWRRYLVDP